MNERDSEQVARSFIDKGYTLTNNESEADVILLNTCSVRDMAEQKAIGKMGMLSKLRAKRPHLVFGFLGCMAQSRGEELLKTSPHVDVIVGTQKFHHVADYVDKILRARLEARMDDERLPIVDVGEEEGSQNTIRDHLNLTTKPSAFVSIMQGCNMHCSFCIVPSTRGPERSRPIPEITDEVRRLADSGTREITLLGQIVNLYGRHEFDSKNGISPFVQLLEEISKIEAIQRIRFTSPHPIGYRTDLINAFTRLPKLAEHVHLPLQSGSNRILKAMRRGYTVEKFLRLVEALRDARPGIAITTDIIVGFPGETEGDFAETLSAVRQADFDNAFIFRYSPRKDTPAASLLDQIPEPIKEDRNQQLLALVNQLASKKLSALVGSEVEILCEGPSKTTPDRLTGRTRTNKIVVFEGSPRHIGQIFNVRVVKSSSTTLYAQADLLS